MIDCAPAFEVMMITVLEKSTFLPCESVICPSSNTWRRILNTSGCAFSISSNNTTEYGCLLTCSLSWPPSSCPTYPGGEPIILATLCFSIYSDISTRIMEFSSPKSASASALESSVLPTPVGPKNRNEPIGRFGSFKPTLPRLIDLATAVTASSWPITRLCSVCSSLFNFALSDSARRLTGILVHCDTTSAMSSSVTSRCFTSFLLWKRFLICSNFSSASFSSLWSMEASVILPLLIASSSSVASSVCVFSSLYTFSGTLNPRRLTFEHASSTTSIALSGRKRSLI